MQNTQQNNSQTDQYRNYHEVPPINSNEPKQEQEKDYGIKFVAYGAKAAFQVSSSKTKEGKHTISVESANKLNPNNSNDRKLDWANKVLFQLTVDELPVFIAVMYGFIQSARFDLHGACNSKFLEVINQENKFFFKSGSQNVQMKAAPVSICDATHFGMLALSCYSDNFPSLSSESVMTGLKVLVKRLLGANQIKQPQQPKP